MGSCAWGLRTRLAEHSHAEDGIWPCYASVDWSRFQTAFLASAGKYGLETRLVSRSMQVNVLVLVDRMAAEQRRLEASN